MKWKTEKRTVSSLVPHEKNPRTMSKKEYDELKESLTKFSLAEIPVINTDNQIIAGHQRIKILFEIFGGEHIIDVRVPEIKLNKNEVKEYLIRSNKNKGQWDFNILANEFEFDDLINWGFKDSDLDLISTIDDLPEEEKANSDSDRINNAEHYECVKCGYLNSK